MINFISKRAFLLSKNRIVFVGGRNETGAVRVCELYMKIFLTKFKIAKERIIIIDIAIITVNLMSYN